MGQQLSCTAKPSVERTSTTDFSSRARTFKTSWFFKNLWINSNQNLARSIASFWHDEPEADNCVKTRNFLSDPFHASKNFFKNVTSYRNAPAPSTSLDCYSEFLCWEHERKRSKILTPQKERKNLEFREHFYSLWQISISLFIKFVATDLVKSET